MVSAADTAVREAISTQRSNDKLIADTGDRVEVLAERLQATMAQLDASGSQSEDMHDSIETASELVSELVATMRRGPSGAALEDWGRWQFLYNS